MTATVIEEDDGSWVSAIEVAEHFNISPQHVNMLAREGCLRRGQDYIVVGGSNARKQRKRFSIKALEAFFSKAPEKRFPKA
jgi:hypothetical protein